MKVAIIGKGKTGGKLLDLIAPENIIGPFGKTNPVDLDKLKQADVVIAFVPGHAVSDLCPILIESKLPVLWGATGFEWPANINNQLIKNKIKWVHATNFSLGMSVVKELINIMSLADRILDNATFSIHEVHHTKKVDAPSGTALSWKSWLNKDCQVTYDRVDDVAGVHEITLKTPSEIITLKHESLDRSLFAKGAMWGAKKILNDSNIPYGITLFENLTSEEIKNAIKSK